MRYTGFYTNDKETGEWRFYKEDGTIDFIKNFDSLPTGQAGIPAK